LGFAVIVPLKQSKGEQRMRAPIKEILRYAIERPDLTTKEAVFSYFSEIVWSIEKDEWDRLTHEQRTGFIEFLEQAVKLAQR
jgi:hypothetical protein